ncbi:hypothetical protein [Mucilaginibacter myungsuensis]|uniref:Uncharacterized protein n=1 Tax=Mucilaginibacter myungsuensis TaxID=649104 RepID=A0A929KUV2_9SPHI|nr:hypothetical protein [Mucilaginibacter myungsuensis]MBE9660853.1 hypothetical protein [Mucilaginibacter myungsuensis]MDN3600900.1 hypothetical protein [Mucilaginibacter myungsuensis]
MKNIFASILILMAGVSGVSAQPKNETLKIFWPEEYKWKIGSNQQSGTQQLVEIVPGNETINNWSIIGSMLVMKGVQMPITDAPNKLYLQTQKRAMNPKLTVLEQNTTMGYKWVLFKIESPSFVGNPKPESQLYYVVQGKSALFVNFVAIKQKQLPVAFLSKWSGIFKRSLLTIK